MVGEGKSSIASSVVSWFDSTRLLGASFCFSRHDPYRRETTFLFSTIAVQLACCHPIINHYVCDAMSHYGSRRRRSSVNFDEFNILLKQPLEAAARQSTFTVPVVIVLDAIDELWGEKTTCKDICLAIRLLEQLPAFVKLFIASRPDPSLQNLFDSMSSLVEQSNLSDVPRTIVDRDILTFIEMRLYAVAGSHSALQDDWPGEKRRIALADRSNGIFLWASVAMEMIY